MSEGVKKHEHWGHEEGEWNYACCACPNAAPDVGCNYCMETYYRKNEPWTYETFKDIASEVEPA